MSNLLEKAIAVALEAHAGVLTRSGRPYIIHPLRLMNQMETEEEMIAAVLHDVVEDSPITLDDLAKIGFSQRVLDALALLTHNKKTTTYEDYILALKANMLARKIKLADLVHNMDVRRLPNPINQRDLDRLKKYRRAWKILTGQ